MVHYIIDGVEYKSEVLGDDINDLTVKLTKKNTKEKKSENKVDEKRTHLEEMLIMTLGIKDKECDDLKKCVESLRVQNVLYRDRVDGLMKRVSDLNSGLSSMRTTEMLHNSQIDELKWNIYGLRVLRNILIAGMIGAVLILYLK